ncbi:MAG: dTDP-glucose 4,6-dehydratase [Candidatus Margulisiibacteriota bacterium]|nr:MAG: dTDP-glucose 4,6-dehydratase [Candidatus Margulisbacteria bacterium GWD2_39_127]OGI01109.1 MAG: dTDP-glucose 4,6-dehydratase [Candidatus Margulisbacteria bacterium GWF2_38_17]OGI07331.1 MAG: dTDP-glucose 4,6-dehydratase [Candidatus Margulisbacteria bacterium GWE2_39_32]PZM80062.1 MAG: dTDP-glucose 4,6-dehydratase [Candidatus Margulisiibacteriota bacterium]HAR62867.1 dTDP-glucose 4,6-dehydratase [Candidatus Margulisiibacteriota bacterium]
MKKVLITGGAGFIGSNFIRHMIQTYPDYQIINFDNLTYAGNLDNLSDMELHVPYTFVKGDIVNKEDVDSVMNGIDYVVHFAAESHVDRSIEDPSVFVKTNVLGTFNLLESAKKNNVKKFLHVSTDEVYGSLGATGYFTEGTPISPNSPYSASKAGSDLLVRSYFETFGFPAVITRCSNNYGPYQFPEKLIPLMITNTLVDKQLPVYGDGLQVRDWLHVIDHCRALDMALHNGKNGEVYNIGGNNEKPNIEIVHLVLDYLKKPKSLIKHVTDRLGHDRRYAIDSSKIQRELGWTPTINFDQGIAETVEWYVCNANWCKRISSGEYRRVQIAK